MARRAVVVLEGRAGVIDGAWTSGRQISDAGAGRGSVPYDGAFLATGAGAALTNRIARRAVGDLR